MFALTKSPIVAVIISVLAASMCFAQAQTPSQRFSPERNVPPSVHVPTAGAKRLPNPSARQNPASFNLSDTPASAFRNSNASQMPNRHAARQVSYQENSQKQNVSDIPAVLRGNNTGNSTQHAPKNLLQELRPPARDNSSVGKGEQQIVVDETQFSQHKKDIDARIEHLKRLREIANQQGVAPVNSNPPSPNVHQVAFQQQPQEGSQISSAGQVEGTMEQPVAHAFDHQRMTPSNQIRNVNAESEAINRSTVDLSTPGIRVQSFGPDSIGINKIATYKVTVTNDGKMDAEQIQIGVGIPTEVDLQNINVSTGHHEITDGNEQSRLLWKIERVPANTTHTIAINLIPRSAQPFEMEVNWSFLPRTAFSRVRVTEPKLQMQISGPTEVQFGEKATYDVSVINPGTGTAEQVAVMLPEELGGEQANIGDVPAGGEKRFKVELFARTAGELNLTANAVGDGDIKASASHDIMVRRANLEVSIDGPPMKYAGSMGQYKVTVANNGDATASNVTAVLALPNGVKYLGGINNVTDANGGLKWPIGTMTSGDRRTFKISCQLDASGQLMFQAGARGNGDLAASSECRTKVDTIADLTLNVEDPKGPLPTGDDVEYKIVVRNRGSRSASGVELVMQFSEGIEPVKAEGFKHKIVTGQVIFAPISRIEPGQEIVLNVTAQALKSGTHIFRAQLTCEESDSREIGEGTTRFFGDEIATDAQNLSLPSKANTANAKDKSDEVNFK